MVQGADKKIRVGLLFGGRSPEHEVSITTAASIAKSADPERLEIVPIYITREGHWQQLSESEALARLSDHIASDQEVEGLPRHEVLLRGTTSPELIPLAPAKEAPAPIDVLFPALHGQGGEDGSVQGLARLADLPCVGAGILGSALGMDKISMKQIAVAHRIPTPAFAFFTRSRWEDDRKQVLEEIVSKLNVPVFVKPSAAGSSVGITKVHRSDELDDAVREAARYDYRILVEQGIDARELEVAVLGNEEPEASCVGEIIPVGEFYDYRGKYIDEGSKPVIPAEIPAEISEKVRAYAVQMFQALDLSGMARADFLLAHQGQKIFFNEVNTIPGFTPISMYPMLMQASGLDYRDLITRLVELAIERRDSTRVETQPPHFEDSGES
jgi:D-alanine-D-alanine ligase